MALSRQGSFRFVWRIGLRLRPEQTGVSAPVRPPKRRHPFSQLNRHAAIRRAAQPCRFDHHYLGLSCRAAGRGREAPRRPFGALSETSAGMSGGPFLVAAISLGIVVPMDAMQTVWALRTGRLPFGLRLAAD